MVSKLLLLFYDYLKGKVEEDKDKRRSILIRIIVIDDAAARDRIIKATNFQTAIPAASLKATDRIQRDIEAYFLQHEWFYDRRKNYYKNLGKPVDRIVRIEFLAQAIMAIILHEPDNARARPTTLIKRESEYARVFSNSMSPEVYLFCAKIMKRVESFLRNVTNPFLMPYKDNFKFHIAMSSVIFLLSNKNYECKDLVSLSVDDFTDELLNGSLDRTMVLVIKFINANDWTIERTAKSRDFVTYMLDHITV